MEPISSKNSRARGNVRAPAIKSKIDQGDSKSQSLIFLLPREEPCGAPIREIRVATSNPDRAAIAHDLVWRAAKLSCDAAHGKSGFAIVPAQHAHLLFGP